MAGYIGSKSSVTQVDGYSEAEADAEFVNDPNGAITVSGSNVGIGVTTVGEKLHVKGTGRFENSHSTPVSVHVNSGNNDYGQIFTSTASAWKNLVLNQYGGNVGIGGTPSKPLHLKTSSGWATMRLEGATDSGGELEFYRGSTKAGGIFFDSSSNLNIRTGNTERMRIDDSGNLLLNTTAVHGTNSKVSVKTDVNKNGIGITAYKSTNTNYYFMNFIANTTSVGNIYSNGSSTTYATSSDYRLKENTVSLTGASQRVNQLLPKRFNFINDETNTLVDGFFAHEVQSVVPEAILGTHDGMKDEEYEVTPAVEATYDEDGNELTSAVEAVMGTRSVPDYQGIDQSKLVPLLTAALQEALTEIASLKTRVEALEA